MILITLTRFTIFWGIISTTTQLTTFFSSIPQYHDHRLISGYDRSSTIEVFTGFSSPLTCGLQCIQKSLCTAINYCTATDGSSICEFLATDICVSAYDKSILQSTPGCRFWEVAVAKNSSTCIMPTAQLCATILTGCQPKGGSLCDTCTRTCQEYYMRYNYKPIAISGHFYPEIWPKGILGPKIKAECEWGNYMYLFKREVNRSTGQFTAWNFNLSLELISKTVERRIYSKFYIFLFGNYIASTSYSVQSFQENGSLSVTFLNSTENYDVLGLNGKPLVNAPFLNDSNVNPECGPFWLLPEGNLSCPGGERLRFWGPIKYNGSWDTGFRCAKATSGRAHFGTIRLEL